ncbi:hypothetical protein [Methylobacillus rhizosphaerae]|nr:hypothetical protein [Methylobacillus rhizosphaerae]
MFDKLILCVSHHQLIAGRWWLGQWRHHEIFPDDRLGHAAFAEFLQRYQHATVYLVIDAREEDFHIEVMPHVRWRAQQAMLQRKLDHVYRGSMFRAAYFLARERDKRRDDQFLFNALTNTGFLQPWLEIVEACQAQLIGAYTLPMLSQRLLQKCGYRSGEMLLSEQLSSGLRQSYLSQGQLRISRQLPLASEHHEELAQFHLKEIEKARLYLLSQRLIAQETPLQVLMLTSAPDAKQLAEYLRQEQGLECMVMNPSQLASCIGLACKQVQQVPELLHMHMLARGNAPDNLAPAVLTRHYKLETWRKRLMAASLVMVLLGLSLVMCYLMQIREEAHQLETVMAEVRQQEQQYGEITSHFPATPVPGADLRTAVHVHERIKQYEADPGQMLRVISQGLEGLSAIQLERVSWVMSTDQALNDTERIADQAASGTVVYNIGFVSGEVKGFAGDYRAALDTVQRFAAQLRKDIATLDVAIIEHPVNVSSYSGLNGNTMSEHAMQREKAAFKLKLVLTPESP